MTDVARTDIVCDIGVYSAESMISAAIHITLRTGLMNSEACAVFVDAVDPTDWAHAGIPPQDGTGVW